MRNYRRYEPHNGISAWFVLPIYAGWIRPRVRVVAPVGHTEEIRRNRRRKPPTRRELGREFPAWAPALDAQANALAIVRFRVRLHRRTRRLGL